jgi:membrane-associated phospholipid phosphatase
MSKKFKLFTILKISLASWVIFGTSYKQFFPSLNSYKSYGNIETFKGKKWSENIETVLKLKNKTKEEIEEEIKVTYVKDFVFLSVPILALIKQNVSFYYKYSIATFLVNVTVEQMKKLVSRERPDKSNKKSFPSGHGAITGLAAIAALELLPVYGKLYILPLTYVAMSRVYTKRHNMSDVLGGVLSAIISWQCVNFASSRYFRRKSRNHSKR